MTPDRGQSLSGVKVCIAAHLCIPEVSGQVVCSLAQLQGDDFMHPVCAKSGFQ